MPFKKILNSGIRVQLSAATTTNSKKRDKIMGIFSKIMRFFHSARTDIMTGSSKGGEGVGISGSINGHEYVDLGLSVKWATCNIGADNPVDWGDYYKWGVSTPYGYGPVIHLRRDLFHDAAAIEWGDAWRMPTKAEFQELIDGCAWTWIEKRAGIMSGMKIVSKKNGNFIFLPASGLLTFTPPPADGLFVRGCYWSSTSEEDKEANYLLFEQDAFKKVVSCERTFYCSIRPVVE